MDKRKKILGLDLGTSSIGWCLMEEKTRIIDSGVRIFPDGRTTDTQKNPLNLDRRNARGIRRNYGAKKFRRQQLKELFLEIGLKLDGDLRTPDHQIYSIRRNALYQKVELKEIFLAMYHINNARGFQSNAAQASDTETSKGIDDLNKLLKEKNCQTLGEYFYKQSQEDMHKKIRFSGTAKDLQIWSSRKMYEKEMSLILDKQSQYYSSITPEFIQKVKDTVLKQRPIKFLKTIIGQCELKPENFRCQKYDLRFQRFRFLCDLHNMRVENTDMDNEVTLSLSEELMKKMSNLYDSAKCSTKGHLSKNAIKKILNLPSKTKINMEINGNRTLYQLNKIEGLPSLLNSLSDKELYEFLDHAYGYQESEQDKQYFQYPDSEKIKAYLKQCFKNQLTESQMNQIMECNVEKTPSNLSIEAIEEILVYLEQGYDYTESCKKAGYDHSKIIESQQLNQLPYYGEILTESVIGGDSTSNHPEKKYGKIANPTIHVGLNQLRLVVNNIIQKHGRIDMILIELARELKQSKKNRQKTEKQQKENQERKLKAKEFLENQNFKPNKTNIEKYILWEESSKTCVYSGNRISITQLLSDNQTQLDHILPFSKSFDNSKNNKVLVLTQYNRSKSDQSIYEAFGKTEGDKILSRAKNVFSSNSRKIARFEKDALEEFQDSTQDSFLPSQLQDTQYFSKLAKNYLHHLDVDTVIPVKGGHTHMFLNKLQFFFKKLNIDIAKFKIKESKLLPLELQKSRSDHRHHLIDSFIIANLTRSLLHKLHKNRFRKRAEEEEEHFSFYEGDRSQLTEQLKNVVISHKPDHKSTNKFSKGQSFAKLHEETCYGYYKTEKKQKYFSLKKSIQAIEKEKEINNIISDKYRVYGIEHGLEQLKKYLKNQGVKKLKMKHKSTAIKIGNGYYVLGGNLFVNIYEYKNKKKETHFKKDVISNFYAHTSNYQSDFVKENPHAKKLMTLYKDDTVALDVDGQTTYWRVVKMGTNGTVNMAPVTYAYNVDYLENSLKNITEDHLSKYNMRKIFVSPLGDIKDFGGYYPKKDL